MKSIGWILMVLSFAGCKEVVKGQARLYVYNGSSERVTVTVSGGDTEHEVLLRPGSGKLLPPQIAGEERRFTVERDSGTSDPVTTTLAKESFTVFNVDGIGCFARADVSGMYVEKKNLIEVSETFQGKELFSMATEIHVAPDERLPAEKPKSPFGFHRLAVVDCKDIDDHYAVAHYIRGLR